MRTVAQLSVLALLWIGLGLANDDKASKMVLQIDKSQVAAAEKALTSIKGVKSVKYDEEAGQLIVLYDKPTVGCCSRLHSALKEAGVEYKLISNQEYPACHGKHEKEHSEAGEPTKKASSEKSGKGSKASTGCASHH
ncbi:MAG: hypothetical protein N2253_00475 [Bacteroidia bacterium]|nr:hypothetical protein [Bacteroidia bacterium]MCX7763350.1 hypothetical protein [Bacteroidia bacterium]MDW8057793.1 hypothetical protein [Bacteroidia bacterium]